MRRRPATQPQVFVAGRPMQSIARWGDLHVVDKWPYGCFELQWNVVLKPYQRIPALIPGMVVEARIGSGVRWAGQLGVPDWESGQMIAMGFARQGEGAMCLSSTLDTTSTVDTAIDQAISRGAVSWIRRASFASTSFYQPGDTTPNLNYLTALMDAWSNSVSKRWGVNAQREVYAAADPLAPTLAIRPGAGELGVSDANQAGRIFGRYQDLTGNYATTWVGSGVPEVGVGLMSYGPISSTTALQVLSGLQQQVVQQKAAWRNGITVTADMVTSIGGQRLGLESVVAGKMARLLGLRDQRGILASLGGLGWYTSAGSVGSNGLPQSTDIVMAETDWDVTGGTVAVTPVNTDGESLSDAIQAAGGELLS